MIITKTYPEDNKHVVHYPKLNYNNQSVVGLAISVWQSEFFGELITCISGALYACFFFFLWQASAKREPEREHPVLRNQSISLADSQ